MDAIYRAKEYGQYIEMDDYMKGVLYGDLYGNKNIVPVIGRIRFISERGIEELTGKTSDNHEMPEMPDISEDYIDR